MSKTYYIQADLARPEMILLDTDDFQAEKKVKISHTCNFGDISKLKTLLSLPSYTPHDEVFEKFFELLKNKKFTIKK